MEFSDNKPQCAFNSCANGFWADKRVLITGHTGFKGSWLTAWLTQLGARVTGFALPPSTNPSMFEMCGLARRNALSTLAPMEHLIGDVRDLPAVERAFLASEPEIVFHMAAQPLVRLSYSEPVETLATNIMGTVHVLDAIRRAPSVRAVVVVTSDKCYANRGWVWGYREDEAMGGHDPYSASKGCAELVAAAYQSSFLGVNGSRATIASARAGNVIGGGDWAADRLVPDAIRALVAGEALVVRNPGATRPWQHVLEPLSGYLALAEKVFEGQREWEGGWNFGPWDEDAVPVSEIASLITEAWGSGAAWKAMPDPNAPHEAPYLKLDSSKARQRLGWRPRLRIAQALQWTVEWYRRAQELRPYGRGPANALSTLAPNALSTLAPSDNAMLDFTLHQIAEFERLA